MAHSEAVGTEQSLLYQFVLYAISGMAALGVHIGIMAILIELLHTHSSLASGLGFIAAIPVHFLIQKSIVFRSHGPAFGQFGIYIGVTLGMLVLNVSLFHAFLKFAGLNYVYVQFLVTASIFVVNFFINRAITFKRAMAEPAMAKLPRRAESE